MAPPKTAASPAAPMLCVNGAVAGKQDVEIGSQRQRRARQHERRYGR